MEDTEWFINLLSRMGMLAGYELIVAISVCGAVHLFDFENLYPFFTIKRVMSIFLLLVLFHPAGPFITSTL